MEARVRRRPERSPLYVLGRRVVQSPVTHCLVLLCLAGLFNELYLRVGGGARLAGSTLSRVRASAASMVALGTPSLDSAPSWLGLWSVKKPRGEFLPGFPRAEQMEKEARELMPLLRVLQSKKFFRIFRINLNRPCPFWVRNDLCIASTDGTVSSPCGVCECDENEIPRPYMMKPIEHFVVNQQQSGAAEEEGLMTPADISIWKGASADPFLLSIDEDLSEATYVDLVMNPPGFTSYRGRSVWGLLYAENCRVRHRHAAGACTAPSDDLLYRALSGLQTAVAVLSSEYREGVHSRFPLPMTAPNLNLRYQTLVGRARAAAPPARYKYSLDFFRRSVSHNRMWLESLYLDFSMLVRALHRLRNIADNCDCYTGTDLEDLDSRESLYTLLAKIGDSPSATAASNPPTLFPNDAAPEVAVLHNASNIFDCVECQKCRLHGKVKLTALQTAVKTLSAAPPSQLERNELVALVNALGYFADAVLVVVKMDQRVTSLRRLTYCSLVTACLALWLLVGSLRPPPQSAACPPKAPTGPPPQAEPMEHLPTADSDGASSPPAVESQLPPAAEAPATRRKRRH